MEGLVIGRNVKDDGLFELAETALYTLDSYIEEKLRPFLEQFEFIDP